jgi:hypothetical protein
MLKPETFADEKLAECTRDARLLFIGLWCFLDDTGHQAYYPRRIKMEVFPGDDDVHTKTIEQWMLELVALGLVDIYENDGKKYIWLPHFLRHQKIDKPRPSSLPKSPREQNGNMFQLEQSRMVRDDSGRLRRDGVELSDTVRTEGRKEIKEGRERESREDDNSIETKELRPLSLSEIALSSQNGIENGGSETSEYPKTLKRELEGFSRRILELLGIPFNPNMLQAVLESIRTKARADGTTHAAAGNTIMARAALAKQENTPDNWLYWFRDARYDVVSKGDPRRVPAKDRKYCGEPGCSQGWVTSKTSQGETVARRCQDCAALWADDSAVGSS